MFAAGISNSLRIQRTKQFGNSHGTHNIGTEYGVLVLCAYCRGAQASHYYMSTPPGPFSGGSALLVVGFITWANCRASEFHSCHIRLALASVYEALPEVHTPFADEIYDHNSKLSRGKYGVASFFFTNFEQNIALLLCLSEWQSH